MLFIRIHDVCTHVWLLHSRSPTVYVTLVHTFGRYIFVHHPFTGRSYIQLPLHIFIHYRRIRDTRTHGFPASVGLAQARPNNSQKIIKWLLVEYPCQGDCFEGWHRLAFLWLHDRSHPKRSCFVP